MSKEKIKKFRRSLSITQAQASILLGINIRTIARWEYEKKHMPLILEYAIRYVHAVSRLQKIKDEQKFNGDKVDFNVSAFKLAADYLNEEDSNIKQISDEDFEALCDILGLNRN